MQVPSSLFESFQASLQQEAKRICRDAAKILRVPEKDLEQKILKSMLKITLVKDNSSTSCCVLILKQSEDRLAHRCRLPCILGTGQCYKHQGVTIAEGGTLTRIQAQPETEQLWCNEETGLVYTENSDEIGFYKNSRLTLYCLEQ